MANDNGAAEDNVDGKTGTGAPGEDPKGSKDGNADDGEFVPVSRLKAALAAQARKHEGDMGGLRAEFEAFKAGAGTKDQPAKDAPKHHSQAELKAAVDAQQITQEQSNDIWAKQVKDEAVEEAERRALAVVEQRSRQERIEADLAQYKRLEPNLLDKSSEIFGKVREEFQDLLRNGSPNNLATERVAIRAVLGPLDKLETAKSARRAAEHHEESGAGGEGRPGKSGKSLFDQLDTRRKAHYERLISQGQYKDKAAVEAELKFAKPNRQAGARA